MELTCHPEVLRKTVSTTSCFLHCHVTESAHVFCCCAVRNIDDVGQFKHQTLVATQTQTQTQCNPVLNTNLMSRICHTPSCNWLKNLGYVRVVFTLQLTFGA